MNKLKRRYPNFCSGFEETEHFFSTKEELLNIDWVKQWTEAKNYYQFSLGEQDNVPWSDGRQALMVELDGGKKWFVIGWLWLETPIGLLEWKKGE